MIVPMHIYGSLLLLLAVLISLAVASGYFKRPEGNPYSEQYRRRLRVRVLLSIAFIASIVFGIRLLYVADEWATAHPLEYPPLTTTETTP